MAAPPSNELFVQGFPVDTTRDTATPLFAQFGTVKEITILPVKPGKNAAAGFVAMTTTEEATLCIQNLHGSVLPGSAARLDVQYSTPRGKRPGEVDYSTMMWGPYGKGASGEPPENETLYIKNLPPDSTKESVTAIFSQYGTVINCNALPPKGEQVTAFVKMSTVEEAKFIVTNVNKQIPNGLMTPVDIVFATPGYKKGGGKDFGKDMKGMMMASMMTMMMKGGYGPMKGGKGYKGW
eukprot:TRINITY_DN298_c0_g1_i1.p1 TRINITY_DN298_c0_g1~~TRINITY_DN298_c0_g1_i1.p1  ORF type:complete len:237 (-),score=49.44 TRINITY_DN298_c0_g1_i1:45-755(-)